MTVELLWKGLLVGIVFGVPAGAIGILSIQRTIERGFWYGFLTGLGSTLADVLYACVGVFGMTFIANTLQRYEKPTSIVGATLIIIYGRIILKKKRINKLEDIKSKKTYVSGFLTAFVVAIMNPVTILSFMIAFSSFGIIGFYSYIEGMQIILGVLLGTSLWWGLLCAIVNCFQRKITDKLYRKMNILLGGLLLVFAMAMLIRCVM